MSRTHLLSLSLLLTVAAVSVGCGDEDTTEEVDEAPEATADTRKVEAKKAEPDGPPAGWDKAPADVAAPPADATKTETGLAWKVLKKGSGGEKPSGPKSKVSVHYTGWTTDGKMFDSSYKRNRPASFGLSGVIAGWTEGLQLVEKGDKVRLWIPEDLAYKGRPGKPAGMLVFDVELLDVTNPPAAPPDVAAAPADATKTATGLAWKVLSKGTGDRNPKSNSMVSAHYSGWTTDGKMFDSSVMRGKPASFPLDGVIKGWTEGLQLLVVGDKARFWIPADLAYGDSPRPGAPKGDLVFDVELLEITDPPEVPADVAAPPADAMKTASGLAYKVIKPGTGSAKPTEASRVQVHYTGWTTDGEMFDSSVVRGKPASFALKGVIKGWTEGLQLMVVGETTRFWIPAELAYGEKGPPGAPQGMLVFDVELLEIK